MPRYNNLIVGFGIMLENRERDLYGDMRYLECQGDITGNWDDAIAMQDKLEAAEWWLDQWCRIFPGVTACEHGLSLQLCYGPGHYPPDNHFY